MEDLIATNSENTAFLTEYVRMLLERGDTGQSRRWVRRLLEATAGSAMDGPLGEAMILAAKADLQEEKPASAIQRINTLIPSGTLGPDDAAQVLRAAQVFEELKLPHDAERTYRRLVEIDSKFGLTLAAFQARRGLIAEAFTICEEKLSRETIGNICAIGSIVLRLHGKRLTTWHHERFASWIAYGKREFPDSLAYSLHEITLLDATDRKEQALEIFNELMTDNRTVNMRGLLANNRTDFERQLGRVTDRTLTDINEAFELLGPQVPLLDTRAMIHLSRGECAEAIRDLEEATHFTVTSPSYH